MIVRVEGLTKSFPLRRGWGATLRAPFATRRARAVDDVSFVVGEGEIFGLLGQNGAGKTTLFKILATLIAPDDGTAAVAGHDVSTASRAVRSLLAPVLANERSLYWRLDAQENLRLYSALQGLAGREAREEEARVLAVTGLVDAGRKLVAEFSSGMRQRLLIARALLGRPRVMLLDEPTRHLDPISARDFRRFLRQTVVRDEGCTVLLATHDADEVWDLCDRVGVLERGRLLAVDATPVLRHRAGNDRLRLWLAAAELPRALAAAAATGVTIAPGAPAIEPEWTECSVTLAGGATGTAALMTTLTTAGCRVARLERVPPSLADLIERVLADAGASRERPTDRQPSPNA